MFQIDSKHFANTIPVLVLVIHKNLSFFVHLGFNDELIKFYIVFTVRALLGIILLL